MTYYQMSIQWDTPNRPRLLSNVNFIINWKTCLLLFLKKRLICNFFPLNIDWLTDREKRFQYFLLLLKLFFATALLTSQHRRYINRPRMQVTKI